jgi:nicotinate-nucleotide--dimethylbenzimidazole phosphoribosyltransferase
LALDVGAEMAQRLIADGAHSLIAGDIGIGNSTAAAAVIAAITNSSEDDVAGRASGADDDMLARKKAIIGAALGTLTAAAGPLTVLEQVGGLELAAITGFIVAGAAARVPVIIDGVAADAALLLAVQLAPDLIDFVVAGHRSGEPAAHVALSHLGIAPLLDLDLRLGEGSGALLALPLLHAAVDVMSGMSVLDALDAFPPTGEVAAVRI